MAELIDAMACVRHHEQFGFWPAYVSADTLAADVVVIGPHLDGSGSVVMPTDVPRAWRRLRAAQRAAQADRRARVAEWHVRQAQRLAAQAERDAAAKAQREARLAREHARAAERAEQAELVRARKEAANDPARIAAFLADLRATLGPPPPIVTKENAWPS
jgi:hypothetical protein